MCRHCLYHTVCTQQIAIYLSRISDAIIDSKLSKLVSAPVQAEQITHTTGVLISFLVGTALTPDQFSSVKSWLLTLSLSRRCTFMVQDEAFNSNLPPIN